MSLPDGVVAKMLDRMDIEYDQRGDELWALCPGHKRNTGKADHNPSWSINVNSGAHRCFSCSYRGNLYTLTMELLGEESAREFKKGDVQRVVPKGYRVSRDLSFPNKKTPATRAKTMPDSELALFDDPPDWALEERRLDIAACQRFGVRWDSEKQGWVLPLREPKQHRLIGYQIKGQRSRLFRNHPPGISKKEVLFGYDVALSNGLDVPLIVVESPLDAVLLDRMGHSAVAVCGSSLSFEQHQLLQNFTVVILALDGDDAGKAETERIRRSEEYLRFRVLRYPEGAKDVGEMDARSIERALSDVGC